MAEVPWDEDVTEEDVTPIDEWNAFKDRIISIAGDKSIGDGFVRLMADTLSNRPDAGFEGRLFYATDEEIWYRDNGEAWEELVRAEEEIRLNSLGEKDYESLDNIPDSFTPESHDHTYHTDIDQELTKNSDVEFNTLTSDVTTIENLVIPVYSSKRDIGDVVKGFIGFVEDEGRIVFEDGS